MGDCDNLIPAISFSTPGHHPRLAVVQVSWRILPKEHLLGSGLSRKDGGSAHHQLE